LPYPELPARKMDDFRVGRRHCRILTYRRERWMILRWGDGIALLRVNLTSNPVRDCCLIIKARSPLAPLKKGGTGVRLKSTPIPLRSGGRESSQSQPLLTPCSLQKGGQESSLSSPFLRGGQESSQSQPLLPFRRGI